MKRIIVFNIGTNIGGIERSLIQFLRFLAHEDCSVDLVLWKKPGELFSRIPSEVNILPSPAPGGWSSLRTEKGDIKKKATQVGRILQYKADKRKGCAWKHFPPIEGEYDIAISYCQNGYSPYYVIDKVVAKKHILFFHHGSYNADLSQYKRDKSYYQQYDQIITVSEANKRMLSGHFPELAERIAVVHNLIDVDKIRKMADKPLNEAGVKDLCKIVTVGRLSVEKGQLFALEVARELTALQFQFQWLFVGDGPEKEHCINKAVELGLSDCCRFIGTRENPYPYIKHADIYVQSSHVEADPVTIQEALVLFKPIVASDIPAMRETLQNGKLGVLCGFSPEVFAKEIQKVYMVAAIQRSLIDNIRRTDDRSSDSEYLLRKHLGLL